MAQIKEEKTVITLESLQQELISKRAETKLGGGAKRIEAHKKKGKLTARERIGLLIDKDSSFMELGLFTGEGMYEEEGGCPSGGTVAGIGYVCGRMCVIVANDATVKAGAWFPITAKKNLRAQEVSIENNLPIIYLVDSAGIYLPLQADVFADKEHFGRVFRNNSIMSSMGIVQIAAIMGSCVAGGAYLPIMSDEAMIVDGTGSVFLAGSYLVKSAIGEDVDNETLGGATTHCEISGVTDYKHPNDEACLQSIRNIVDKMGARPRAGFSRVEPVAPKESWETLPAVFSVDRAKPYDMGEILKRLCDNSEWEEYKELYGKTLVCAYARIDGWAVGIVANQRKMVKSKKGEMQMGGVIYSDSADKAARFIMNCNQKRIPLLFIQDVSGFMVGSRSEHGGIIKDGAKLVNVMSNSVVPKLTLYVGNSFGAGNYAMCGKAYDPRFLFAWPTAQVAVMSGAAAANTLLQIEKATLQAKGKTIDPDTEKTMFQTIKARYDRQTSPYYAAARLWIDELILPSETRTMISMGLEAADHAPVTRAFNPGVLQT